MRAVTSPEPGVLEVNYMWLPTWVGMNSQLLQDMGEVVRKAVIGHPLGVAETLGHEALVGFLVKRYPRISGLREYLDGMSAVTIDGQEG